MKIRQSLLSILVLACFTTLLLGQEFKNRKSSSDRIQAATQKWESLTESEKKLGGALVSILRLWEEADSSNKAKERIEKIRKGKGFDFDSNGRIRVVVLLRSSVGISEVKSLIERASGRIVAESDMGPVNWCRVVCDVAPKVLRALSNDDRVCLIYIPPKNIHNGIISIGDAQLACASAAESTSVG